MKPIDFLTQLTNRYPALTTARGDIERAFNIIKDTFSNGGKLLVCGNGGSCSDSEHIAGELLKSFLVKRALPAALTDELSNYPEGDALARGLEGGLPCVSLCGHPSLTTAFSNDAYSTMTFAQQLVSLGNSGDTLLAISTSGNSLNCVYAAIVAKSKRVKVVALTGSKDSRLSELADVCVKVPQTETFMVQEYHLPVYHCLCAMLECEFFGDTRK